jgi:hypothetical protein
VRSLLSRWRNWLAALLLGTICACADNGAESVANALAHAATLVEISAKDVGEVRQGLPRGAEELARRWKDDADPLGDPEIARAALATAQNKVQDLRIAKSTFFALATVDGIVVRNDREQDLMAGKALFQAFPGLDRAAKGGYVEALGTLTEAHGVKGKPDAEWVAASGVKVGDSVKALYVTGWAWSSYAYRLEFALRGRVAAELKDSQKNLPLLYTFVVVGSEVYSAPQSPEINARAIAELGPLEHLTPDGSFSSLLDITGRRFALGVRVAPALGSGVAIGVLRSET